MGIINNVMWPYLYQFGMLNLVFSSSWLLTTTMKFMSAEKHSSVVSLLNGGILIVKSKLKLVWGRVLLVGSVRRWRKIKGSKLSPCDKQSIVHQISIGKLDNAVQATQFIPPHSLLRLLGMCWWRQGNKEESLYAQGVSLPTTSKVCPIWKLDCEGPEEGIVDWWDKIQ